MGSRTGRVLRLALCAALFAEAAMAMDVGVPQFTAETLWGGRGEIYYERYGRELKFEDDGELNRVAGGAIQDNAELDMVGVRFTFPVVETFELYINGGVATSQDSDPGAPFLGVGAYFLPAKLGPLTFSGTASVRYVLVYLSTTRDDVRIKANEQWTEFSLGEVASANIRIGRSLTVTPYAGATLSWVTGNGDGDARMPGEESTTRNLAFTVREDSMLVGVAGLSLLFGDQVSVRAEARGLGDESLSVALGYAF